MIPAISSQKLFWDGRETNLEKALTEPFFNHIEMGIDNFDELVNRINSRSYYPELFQKAFGDSHADVSRIAFAMRAFVERLSANDSEFDQNRVRFTLNPSNAKERGLQLFFGKYDCGSCHNLHSPIGYETSFDAADNEMVNIGLDVNYQDQGRSVVTENPDDRGKFKIPNLRNVAITGPYMHDGRFETLEEVIEHYSTGVANHPNLDDRLKDASGKAVRLNITEQDKKDLVAFLESLTSRDLLTNPLLSDPFKTR